MTSKHARRIAWPPAFLLTLAAALPAPARADQIYIPVGQAKVRKSVFAVAEPRLADGGASGASRTIVETVENDLKFMDLFRLLDRKAHLDDPRTAGVALGQFPMSNWSSIGAEYLLKSQIGAAGGNLSVEAHLFDIGGTKAIFAKRYVGRAADAVILGHTLANDVVTALTGLPGIFLSNLTMVCDRGSRMTKEVFMMDFDGTNVKQITSHRSTVVSPSWSPDGTRIVYSVYQKRRTTNVKNIDLYEYDFASSTVRMLSNRTGINSGAQYAPDGKKIALTMSFLGNPEIFLFEPKTNSVTRVTKSYGVDVDPNWSPDGRQIAFVSSRSGASMVYKMNADGSNPQRLTFAGKYNAAPTWSPQGNKIGFAGMIDGVFDIFLMNPDGTNIERLTKSQGMNEDPHFSADGNFLAFASNRTGQYNIYVMNVDGTFVKRLTYGLGNCTSPKWSNPPR
jgi:TolB protein